MRNLAVVILLLALLMVPASGVLASEQATQQKSITELLQPNKVIIGVKDTDIATNATIVRITLPDTSAGIFLMSGIALNDDQIKEVQDFISKYKSDNPNKIVFQYYFEYSNNGTTIAPHIYDNVDYYVVSPMSYEELLNYTNRLAGKKIFVVENYLTTTARLPNNQTGQNVTEMIEIDKLIQLYKEGKIAGVMFPFYEVEKSGSEALYNKMVADAKTLQSAGIPTVGIVQPYISFFTGSVDLPRTLGSIVLSNKDFGMTVFLSWDNMPVALLAYLDPQKFQSGGGSSLGIHIDRNKLGIYAGMIPAVIIIAIFIVAIAKKLNDKKGDEKKKGKDNGKKSNNKTKKKEEEKKD